MSKLTYCSFAHDGSDRCTVVILPGHYPGNLKAFEAARHLLNGPDGKVPDGQFMSWDIPDDDSVSMYAPHVGKAIDGEEARDWFGFETLGEWRARQ